MKTVCVFCASGADVPELYFEVASDLGKRLARAGWETVFGGGNAGLMGALARSVHESGGRLAGVIPRMFYDKGFCFDSCDEVVVTEDLRERKSVMTDRSDAFIALPGGFGTMDEISEVLSQKQLGMHAKPMVLVNAGGFFDPLIELFERFQRERFSKSGLYRVAPDPERAVQLCGKGE